MNKDVKMKQRGRKDKMLWCKQCWEKERKTKNTSGKRRLSQNCRMQGKRDSRHQ